MIAIIGMLMLSLGCPDLDINSMFGGFGFGGAPVQRDDPVLKQTQGLGVTQFDISAGAVAPETQFFIGVLVRNHLSGDSAEDVSVTLMNLNPFKILDCGGVQDPNEIRPSSCVSTYLYEDTNLPFREHYVKEMLPAEDLEFDWTLVSPTEQEIANMYYTHPIYYRMEYLYKTTAYLGIPIIENTEYARRRSAGDELPSGSITETAGEIKFRSTTSVPIRYASRQPIDVTLTMVLQNQGEGFPSYEKWNPLLNQTGILVIIQYPLTDVNPEPRILDFGWIDMLNLTDNEGTDLDGIPYDSITNPEEDSERLVKLGYFNNDLTAGEIDDFIQELYPSLNGERNYVFRIVRPQNVIDGVQLTLPLKLNEGIFVPVKTLPFNIFTAYKYILTGSTSVNVIPIR